ncbi:MAG: PQQ-binding-like beta-propeller repeat protein [Pirellulaceae bacterium]|nr:PQQ-binding-like beta-propeller repeat protein [Pirellulaceae bacterium]
MRNSYLCLVVLAAFSSSSAAEDWPQFRGPGSAGVAAKELPLPTDIGPDKHVLWKTELPPGHSSPAIIGNKIFLTAVAATDDKKEQLETICLDRTTGKIIWRAVAPHKTLENIHGIGSYAQPSPAADGERVVVLFGSSGLYCYDHDGKPLWYREMGPFNDDFGAAASPLIVGDRVILGQDHDTGSFLAAFDKKNGEPVWHTDRSEFSRNYGSPVVWEVNGKKQLVMAGTLRVAGYDLDTGRELWTVRGISRVVCMTPVIGPENTLIVAGWSAGGDPGEEIRLEPFDDFLAKADANKNGTLEETEVAESAALKTRFTQCDRNKDGHVIRGEYDEFRKLFELSQNVVLAIKPGGSGDVTDTHVAWKYSKFTPFCASPLAYRGRVFTIKDGGILSSLDATTGEPGKSGRVPGTGNYYASPAGGDGKVYLLSQRGTLSVVSPAAQWQVLHTVEFGEDCYATPALLDGRIYLRTSGHLYCFGSESQDEN